MTEKAVIFDMDGVLADTGEFHKLAWFDLAEREGWRFSCEMFNSTFGMQNYQIIPMISDRELTREEIDTLGDWKEDRFRQRAAEGLQPFPGVTELLGQLDEAGFGLAVGSSGPRKNVEFILTTLGIRNFFSVVVAGEDVNNGKPAPDTFLKASDLLGLEPSRCIVIEDATHGVQAARAGGMQVVAVTNTVDRTLLADADRIVDCLTELTASDFEDLIGSPVG